LWLLASLGSLAPLCGCQSAGATITPQQQGTIAHRATDLLLRAAQNEDPIVCANAIEALVKVAPEEGLPRFRTALRAQSPLVRFAGLVALGTVKDKQSRTVVRQFLNDTHPLVRLAAAFALYRYGDTQQAKLLVSTLEGDADESVRSEAAHLIGLLGERRAIKHLQVALRRKANEASPRVLMLIETALARLGDPEAVRRLMNDAQGAPATRVLALQGLAEVGPPAAREALQYRMGPAEDYIVPRLIAARGLARLGDRTGYDLAMQNIAYVGKDPKDPDESMRVRTNAALVLGELGDPRALPALADLAEKANDPYVQIAACCAIGQIVNRTEHSAAAPGAGTAP
jgi:HEAT repeat protein